MHQQTQPPCDPVLLKAIHRTGRASGGGSGAQLYGVAEDNNTYLVKLKGNRQGIRVLFNEYVSGRLGELVGVPFGRHVLVDVPEPLLPPANEPNVPRREPGTQFGTTYYPGGQTDISQLQRANNFNAFPCVLVFDTFIDRRNGRQHLVYASSGDQNGIRDTGAIFDQGYAFTGTPNWSAESLRQAQNCTANNGLRLRQSFPNLGQYEPYLERLEALRTEDIRAIVVQEPPLEEWHITEEEAIALVGWLGHRKMQVRTAIQAHLR